MPPKKTSLTQRTKKSNQIKSQRENETSEEHKIRLATQRSLTSTLRAAETLEQHDARLEIQRLRTSSSMASETSLQREIRLRSARSRSSTSRIAETILQRETRQTTERSRSSSSRASENPEQSDARRIQNRSRMAQFRRNPASYERIAFQYTPAINYTQDELVAIGSMNKVCQYCNAYKYQNEAPGMCCANGKIALPELLPPPEPLLSLLSGKTNQIYSTS